MIGKVKLVSIVLVLLAGLAILCGCNDTLRQFIITVPKPDGTPASQANAVVLSTNPAGNGSALHLNVSGDDIVAQVTLGINPLFLGKAGTTAFVINGDGTVNSYLSLLALSNPPHVSVLPPGSTGAIAGGTSSSGNFFITDRATNNVNVFTSGVAAITQTVTVGTAPVAVAGNAFNSKTYVINQGSGDVTVVSTIDNTVIKTIKVGANPIWGVMSNDAVNVFVVNQGDGTAANPGSVSVIDTTLDQVIPCSPGPPPLTTSCNAATGAISVGTNPATSSPNFAFFDPTRQRLYVSNTGENTISVIKADGLNLGANPQVLPQLLANISVKDKFGTPHIPVSVTALADGTKAYAALGDCPAGTNHTNLLLPDAASGNLSKCAATGQWVAVIDALALRQSGSIQVGPGAVSIDSAADSSRVYLVSALDTTTVNDNLHNPACATDQPCGPVGAPNCTSNCIGGPIQPARVIPTPSVSIIRTSTDSIFQSTPPPTDASVSVFPFSFRVPQQVQNCSPAKDGKFNQTVPIPCAGQEAFVVRIFP
jgi:YVTN family beta-propeller protein